MSRSKSLILPLIGILAAVVAFSGCQKAEEKVPEAPTPVVKTAGGAAPQKSGGAVPNTELEGAPSGVKTGIDGGKK